MENALGRPMTPDQRPPGPHGCRILAQPLDKGAQFLHAALLHRRDPGVKIVAVTLTDHATEGFGPDETCGASPDRGGGGARGGPDRSSAGLPVSPATGGPLGGRAMGRGGARHGPPRRGAQERLGGMCTGGPSPAVVDRRSRATVRRAGWCPCATSSRQSCWAWRPPAFHRRRRYAVQGATRGRPRWCDRCRAGGWDIARDRYTVGRLPWTCRAMAAIPTCGACTRWIWWSRWTPRAWRAWPIVASRDMNAADRCPEPSRVLRSCR
jgi:hypothetical protein